MAHALIWWEWSTTTVVDPAGRWMRWRTPPRREVW